ncbi:hypothetical protein [Pyxidicoccus sp. MSG2]|uniref:hypothetical protein n=1 Tax=Pyxidicoccus sp. MSG2 TaxID=2996790 RepID=UPI0022700462|nr:hypothetical protein [Pyxidicoccus sp. MSG2]MCY1021124.1 hypothetical protein [Pyxidicoccus sp. MSG2]
MGLDLRLQVTESGGRPRPDAPPVPDQTHEVQVRLRRGWIGYRESEIHDVLLDFARRRRVMVDEGARTYVESSLYAPVCARHFELSNIEHVRSVIAAGKGDTSDFEPIIMEHQLAVFDKARRRTLTESAAPKKTGLGGLLRSVFSGSKKPGDLTVQSDSGQTVYATAEGRRLLAHSTDGTDVEPDMGRQFVKFLGYRYGGHPLILERLASASRVPSEIQYSARMMSGLP